jgi:hypothetical protein
MLGVGAAGEADLIAARECVEKVGTELEPLDIGCEMNDGVGTTPTWISIREILRAPLRSSF